MNIEWKILTGEKKGKRKRKRTRGSDEMLETQNGRRRGREGERLRENETGNGKF